MSLQCRKNVARFRLNRLVINRLSVFSVAGACPTKFFFFFILWGQLFLLHPLYIGLFFFQIIFILFSYTATLKERKSSGSKDLAVFFATFLRHSASFTYTILIEFCEKSVLKQKIEPK